MRLIDADKCPCIVCEETRNAHCTYEHRSCSNFCEWLNKEAYDIDKVVEELENEISLYENSKSIMGGNDADIEYDGAMKGLGKAIEIVKQGGAG